MNNIDNSNAIMLSVEAADTPTIDVTKSWSIVGTGGPLLGCWR